MKVDNPGDFSNKVGYDLYVNPWWALHAQCHKGQVLASHLTNILGPPDLWFQGLFHELLWGDRELERSWRPSLCANISGTNGKTWFNWWLPWRASGFQQGTKKLYAANILDEDINLDWDTVGAVRYKKALSIPRLST